MGWETPSLAKLTFLIGKYSGTSFPGLWETTRAVVALLSLGQVINPIQLTQSLKIWIESLQLMLKSGCFCT